MDLKSITNLQKMIEAIDRLRQELAVLGGRRSGKNGQAQPMEVVTYPSTRLQKKLHQMCTCTIHAYTPGCYSTLHAPSLYLVNLLN